MSVFGKPAAVLHERAGNLEVFKLYGGRQFLIVDHSGSLNIPEWTARELHKWLGENLPREPESSYAYAKEAQAAQAMQNRANSTLPSTAYAEEAPQSHWPTDVASGPLRR